MGCFFFWESRVCGVALSTFLRSNRVGSADFAIFNGLGSYFSFIRHLSMVVVRLSGYVVVAGSTMLQEFMWILGQFGGV